MKNKIILAIATSVFSLSIFMFASCKKNSAIASPPPPSPITGFRNLDIHGSVNVVLIPDTINQVQSVLNSNINYNLKKQTLSITGSGTAMISIKELDALTVTGSVDVLSNDSLRLDQLIITSHGSSTINLKLVMKNYLTINVTGSSDSYVLSGRSPKLIADINGSPEMRNYSFLTSDCNVSMTGSGVCEIFTSNSLSANLTGSSILYYKGNPSSVNPLKITGSAQLIKK